VNKYLVLGSTDGILVVTLFNCSATRTATIRAHDSKLFWHTTRYKGWLLI